MKRMEEATEGGNVKLNKAAVPAAQPPPPPPLPKFSPGKVAGNMSLTNQEIAKFWRRKHMEEEDHLLAAIKAAARIRARNLTEDDYKCFEESLKDDNDSKEIDSATIASRKIGENNKELHVGIKDWWTKSKYAYLNQPSIESVDTLKRRTSTYIQKLCNYKAAPTPTASFGIF